MSDCPHCDGTGFLIDEATNTARDCSCRPLRISRRKAAKLEARIPDRYRGVGFDREPVASMPDLITRPVKAFTRRVEEQLDQGRGLWFAGDVGTGKTTLAMLVSKSALEAGRTVAIYSVPRLLNLVREAMVSEEGKLEFLDRLTSVDLLHLDDLGAQTQTEWVLEQLYSIINTRYEDQRSLVVTSNQGPDELAKLVGERTVSRITEMCGGDLQMKGDDRRLIYQPPA
jgi:DNA replication protein DnaC